MGKRIMVVDDSRVIWLQLQEQLEGTEYELVAYCQSGEDAIAKYDEVQPDLVTMDIIMHGMDGLEAAEAILKEHPDAKIVMMSSLAYDDTMDEAKAIGTKDFISKPFEREQVLEAFGRILGGSDSGEA